jgi:hypothetical protein
LRALDLGEDAGFVGNIFAPIMRPLIENEKGNSKAEQARYDISEKISTFIKKNGGIGLDEDERKFEEIV